MPIVSATPSIYQGNGPPATTLGTDGDTYYDVSSRTVYGPRLLGLWGAGAQLGTGFSSNPVSAVPGIWGAGVPPFPVNPGGFVSTQDYLDDYDDRLTGRMGARGPRGRIGANGLAGNTILSGNGIPGAYLGNEGDFYYDATNTVFYGPRTAGVWGAGVSLLVGHPATRWLGPWSGTTAYLPNDTVSSGGITYVALAANTGSAPPSANWIADSTASSGRLAALEALEAATAIYPTLAGATAATIPASVQVVTLLGQITPGDGLGGTFAKSAVVVPGGFTSASGLFFASINVPAQLDAAGHLPIAQLPATGNFPTTLPATAGIWWLNGGSLSVSQ